MAATAAATPQQLRTRITYRQDQTQTVTVEGPGFEQPGVRGMEYRYMLAGHGIMWVPPAVHAAIQGAAAGRYPADFEITKRRNDTWETVHVVDESATPQPATRPAPAGGNGWPAQSESAPPPAPRTAPTAAPPAATGEPYNASMYTALCAAIRTAAAVETFARQIGRAVAFETGDIRAIAATLFIHAEGGR